MPALKVILYPIIGLFDIFRDNAKGHNIKLCKHVLLWLLSIFVYALITILINSVIVYFTTVSSLVGSTTAIFSEEGYIEYDGGLSLASQGGELSLDSQGYYVFNVADIPSNVRVPANYCQNGTPKQRGEIYQLAVEICSLPEIEVTPQQLLGVTYPESTFALPEGGISIFKGYVNSTPDENNDMGPFYMRNGSVEEMKRNYKIFISKYEPNSGGTSQVVTSAQTFDGKERPRLDYYPDAMYNMALSLTKNMSETESKFAFSNRTNKLLNSLKAEGKITEEECSMAKYDLACGIHNSAHEYCCGTWRVGMVIDIIRQHGGYDKWFELGNSKTKLIGTLTGYSSNLNSDGVHYLNGYGPCTDPNCLIQKTKRTLKSEMYAGNTIDYEAETYLELYKHTKLGYPQYNHYLSHYHGFACANGGRWIWESIEKMLEGCGFSKPNSKVFGSTDGAAYTSYVELQWDLNTINRMFPRSYDTGKLTEMTCFDAQTLKPFKLNRSVGTNHMDVEPLTAADTQILASLFGESWGSYVMRPIFIVNPDKPSQLIVGSLAGGIHAPELSVVKNNNCNGILDLHLKGSKTHAEGGVTEHEDNRHTTARSEGVKLAKKYFESGIFSVGANKATTISGVQAWVNGCVAPMDLSRKCYITSPYNENRGGNGHKGIDVQYVNGTQLKSAERPIYSVCNGRVINSSYSNSAGQWVAVQGDNGFIYKYMHMERGKQQVITGELVKAGQVLGYEWNSGQTSGTEGSSTGWHLHFQVEDSSGKTYDPTAFFAGNPNVTRVY